MMIASILLFICNEMKLIQGITNHSVLTSFTSIVSGDKFGAK